MRTHIQILADIDSHPAPHQNDGRPVGQHPGLLLNRFLAYNDAGSEDDRKKKLTAGRRAILKAALAAAGNADLWTLYKFAFERWETSLSELTLAKDFTTAGRLIVGLGTENVLETGIRLHHTYGLPVVPGSALKGLAAHYCDCVLGAKHLENEAPEDSKRFRKGWKEEKHEYHKLLFGTTDDGGVITFHDAWITPDSLRDGALRLDVMTPHHLKWQTNDAPPTDFDSPNPVSFLSVAGTFHVRLSWSGPADTPSETARDWTGLAMNLLEEALSEWGIGGKTSSGYGRLIALSSTPATSSTLSPVMEKQSSKAKPLPKTWQTVDARIVPDTKGQGRLFARHEESGLVGPIQKPEDVPEQERQLETPLKLIVAVISTDGKQIQFLYPTPANQQRAQQANQPAARGQSPGKRGKR